MQTVKLGISQKIFAQLERVFKRAQTRDCPLEIAGASFSLPDPQAECRTFHPGLTVRTKPDPITTWQSPVGHELPLSACFGSTVHGCDLWLQTVSAHTAMTNTFLSAASRAVSLDFVLTPTVRTVDCQLSPKILRSRPVSLLNLIHPPPTHSLPYILLADAVHRTDQLPGNIPVVRQPMVGQWLPKAELRICWRKAVLKTKRTPQELTMLGFFFGVPLSQIRKIEFTHNPVQIKYWLIAKPKKNAPTTSLSLFHSIPDQTFFLTSSQDE